MIGQGSPSHQGGDARTTCACPPLGRLLIMLAALCLLGSRAAADDDAVRMRLRVTWGGGAAQRWAGKVALTAGSVGELQLLGLEADEPGSIWIDGPSQVAVASLSRRTFDGFDITVTAPLSAEVVIGLRPQGGGPTAAPQRIPLADLLKGMYNQPLDPGSNRLAVARAPGDALHVHSSRDALVLAPGETLPLEIEPRIFPLPTDVPLLFRAQVVPAKDGSRVSSEERELDAESLSKISPVIPFELVAPREEGVYEVQFSLLERRRRLGPAKPIAERSVQFVVIGSEPQAVDPASPLPSRVVVEIDPAVGRWWERMSGLALLPGFRKGPMGSGHTGRLEHRVLGPLTELRGPAIEGDVSWEAYPLPGLTPGQLHLLEIEYPADYPQRLGISLTDSSVAGGSQPVSYDAGIEVAPESESVAKLLTYRLAFWPRTSQPALLLSNLRPGTRGRYGKIRVLGARQVPPLTLGLTSRAEPRLPPLLPQAPADGRLFAAYLGRPLLARNFMAEQMLDPALGRSLDDWTTFYQGTTRLVECLHSAGYNGLLLTVYADGSSIYPSAVLQPTPRFDTGVFHAGGHDPHRKDVLELVFRIFDRERLKLVPALSFAAPLPQLEVARREHGDGNRLAWIGSAGRAQQNSAGTGQWAPRYNPLSSAVQQALVASVDELINRYSHHSAFSGLALQISADSFLQLSSAEWGLDDETIGQFEQDTGLDVPGEGAGRFAARAAFLEKNRAAWLDWRAKRLGGLFEQIAERLQERAPGARLYLTVMTTRAAGQSMAETRSALLQQSRLDEQFRELGVDADRLAKHPNITLVRMQSAGTMDAREPQAIDHELAQGSELDRVFREAAVTASLVLHEPVRSRLGPFDAAAPFPRATINLITHFEAVEQRRRQAFVRSLAELDTQVMVDGGWLLSLSQNEALREMVSAYRQLPSGPFETVADSPQPVTIRTLTKGESTYAYLVNDSPWNVAVSMRVVAPPGCNVERLGRGRPPNPLTLDGSTSAWSAVLEPHGLLAVQFSAPGVRIEQAKIQLDSRVHGEIEREILDLAARAAALANPRPLPGPLNANFEAASSGAGIAGWQIAVEAHNPLRDSGSPLAGAEQDAQSHGSDTRSVRLFSEGPKLSLLSTPFPTPPAGRMFLLVHLRAGEGSRAAPLRLIVEDTREGSELAWSAVVGTHQAPLGAAWRPYILRVDDIPISQIGSLRVRFELAGPGEVWIDEVEVLDPPFTAPEHSALRKIIKLAEYQLEQRRYADCARFLVSYWPKYLAAHTPAPPAGSLPPQPAAGQPPAETARRDESRSPGMFERLRGAIPRWW